MRRRYIRNEPDRRDDVAAAVVAGTLAAGIAAVAFYLVRLLLAREPVERTDIRTPERVPGRER
jgi:hypothetical protein